MPKSLRILLIASLAFNIFLAGWWVGDVLRPRPGFMPPMPRPMTFADRVRDSLSEEGRQIAGPLLAEIDQVLREGFESRQAQFDRLRELASQDPIDSAAFDATLAAIPDARLENEREQWRLTRELLDQLSPADRMALARFVFPQPRPNGPPPGDRPMPPPPGQ